jgi:pimeloyl-ACP methyl ester carboxylesterase
VTAGSRTLRVATNGIVLSVTEAGAGPAVVLCHGFPELAYSWRHQVPALAAAGFRVLAPDMRGYGGSSRPAEVEAYDVLTVGEDLIGLLDALGEDRAVFVGHDWGASVVWQLALTHPERVRAVAGLSVPFAVRAPAPPLSILQRRLGEEFYMVWWQRQGPADEALSRNVRFALTTEQPIGPDWEGRELLPPPRPAWISEEELAVYEEAFVRTGFSGGLNYYRNIDRNWELTAPFDQARVEQPALFLTGSEDLVRRFMPDDDLDRTVPLLREHLVLEGAGHHVQQERPDEVSAAILRLLEAAD